MDQLSPNWGTNSNTLNTPSQNSLNSSSGISGSGEYNQNEKVVTPPRSPNVFKLFLVQLWIMIKRNFILQIRYRKSTISQAFAGPFIFLLLLFILQKADNSVQRRSYYHPKSYPLLGLLQCQGRSVNSPCINVMYTPNTPETQKIMQTFSINNEKRTGQPMPLEDINLDLNTPPTRKLGIVAVPNANFIYSYTLNNPNTTLFGIEFTTVDNNYRYQVWFNSTQTNNNTDVFNEQLLSFQRGIDEAIVTVATNSSAGSSDSPAINVQLKDWPIVPPKTITDQIVANLGALFFFCAEMIIFISILNTIVSEKEAKLTDSLVMMGLKKEVYWLSYLISNAWLVVICSLVTCIFGLIFDFSVFRHTNFLVLLITFILFGLAMVTFAFFITTFCRAARVAVLVGIFIFILGLIFESFVFSNAYVGYIWWDKSTSKLGWIILMFIPFFNFGKIYLDMSQLTNGKYDYLTDTSNPGPGFKWGDLYNPIPASYLVSYNAAGRKPDVPAPIQSWYLLLMNIILYLLLTLYFDKVIPDEFGRRRSPLFFLSPRYLGLRISKGYTLQSWLQKYRKAHGSHADEDADVAAERDATFDLDNNAVLRIANLRKVYRKSIFYESNLDKVAVNDLCLTLKEGKCLALLGQNGAGKSTTMNILSGLTPATAGDALMYGLSVREDMDSIRKIMGVCPQHDLLFNDLTAREHIRLYAGIKMIPAEEIEQLINERLAAVRLTKVADKFAGTYSGGMKRRLSMVISTIGDPQIIFMDEPTTGMDPLNRRHVWSFIENFKRGRVIVLTTHSMEEADVLGDRICVMAHGRLRALGNAIHLKNKFGAGYRVSLVTHPLDSDRAKQLVEQQVPNAVLEDDSAGALIYELPMSALPSLPALVKWFEENQEVSSVEDGKPLISSWGVSQKGLEEAFLKLIREANPNGYQGYEAQNTN
ncbi:1691_t:CDS:2 [Ambispora leptoticha]|uniref:1691_t:CDS:1 n=1 Tax=Ambispora leptoticha TaxID=144679 RepID=A0A9N9FXF8_9GLOM|nr:1691_t:CDS:2 [Ambispora leptoticha]